METLVLTVPQLAALLSVHPNTIRRAIAAGDSKAAHGGGRNRYRISRIDAQDWWRALGGGALFPENVPAAGISISNAQTEKEMAHLPPRLTMVPPERIAAILAPCGSMKTAGDDGRSLERFRDEKHADTGRPAAVGFLF